MEDVLEIYQALHDSLGEGDIGTAFCQRLRQTIQELIDSLPPDFKIGIRPMAPETEKLLEEFDFSKKNVDGVYDRQRRRETFCGYPCFSTQDFQPEEKRIFLIVSYYHHQEIKEELEKSGIRFLDLYDALARKGFCLGAPYYMYQPGWPMVLNYFYLRYLESKTDPDAVGKALRAFLQAAVEFKDFVMLDKVYQEDRDILENFPILRETWEKAQDLLKVISCKIENRKKRDILLFWTDAVSYSMLPYLPETKARGEEGCFFRRAHTHTPYTGSTLRAMFKGELPIDDYDSIEEEINQTNSPLICYLENCGYDVKCMLPSRWKMGEPYIVDSLEHLSCNLIWWNGLEKLLEASKPCFYLFHFAAEPHPPIVAPNLREPIVDMSVPSEQRNRQIRAAYSYLDQCLSLYSRLTKGSVQIFFSDHGTHMETTFDWTEDKLHPYLCVVGDRIPQKMIDRFFPYQNFWKLIEWIQEPDRFSLDDICTDEAVFQDIDFYHPRLIDISLRQTEPRIGIAYRGVRDYCRKYVLTALGEEFFYHITDDGTEIPTELTDENLRKQLREKTGNFFLDIYKYDKFKHTRKLYEHIRAQLDPVGRS
nr:hypothetical protein [uncultured Oscillibacter sp.]